MYNCIKHLLFISLAKELICFKDLFNLGICIFPEPSWEFKLSPRGHASFPPLFLHAWKGAEGIDLGTYRCSSNFCIRKPFRMEVDTVHPCWKLWRSNLSTLLSFLAATNTKQADSKKTADSYDIFREWEQVLFVLKTFFYYWRIGLN